MKKKANNDPWNLDNATHVIIKPPNGKIDSAGLLKKKSYHARNILLIQGSLKDI